MKWCVAFLINDIVSIVEYNSRQEMLDVVASYAKVGHDVIATWTEIVS